MTYYHTLLKHTNVDIRNNVKSAMINEMIHYLQESVGNGHGSVNEIHTQWAFTMPEIKVPPNPLHPAGEDVVPCLNMDCEWIKFLTLFYGSTEFKLLPAYNKWGHCIICDLNERGELDCSKTKVTKRGEAVIT
jgi:hypothetical protein